MPSVTTYEYIQHCIEVPREYGKGRKNKRYSNRKGRKNNHL